MLENKAEYDKMAEVESSHWWYCTLHQMVFNTIQKQFSGNTDIEILDAGCGTGGMLQFLSERNYNNLKGIDVSGFAVEHCRSKGLNVTQGTIGEVAKYFTLESKDVIVSNDVLYFLTFEEQKKVLAVFYSLLKPGGILILNLPALKIFSGIHDLSVSIKERYHHTMLVELLPSTIVKKNLSFRYWPVLLSPLILLVRKRQRINIKSGNYVTTSDINLPAPFVNSLLKGLMKFEINYLPKINFGSSLYIMAKK